MEKSLCTLTCPYSRICTRQSRFLLRFLNLLSIYCRSKRIHTPERWRRRKSKNPSGQIGRGLTLSTRRLVGGRLIGFHAES
jgi:hypothetical protein